MSKGVISLPVKKFTKFSILAKLLLAKKHPKLGIQLPNAGDENRGFHMLTVIIRLIYWLWVTEYNIYSSNLFYTNVSISTSLRGVPGRTREFESTHGSENG